MDRAHENSAPLSPDLGLRQACVAVARAFKQAGFENSETEARLLVGGVLNLDAADLVIRSSDPLGSSASAIDHALARRLRHEPLSRILGRREFYGREFEISPAVLDPRPDTETLIDAVIEIAGEMGWVRGPLRVADIGTGSGAILVTLLSELPMAEGLATDVSESALAVAGRNARRQGVERRVIFHHTSILNGVAGPLDLIVANPPYIARGEVAQLDAAVRDFDPHLALDGGPDGLAVYREIAREISRFPELAWVILEVGAGQADAVAALFAEQNRAVNSGRIRFRKDLGGHTRSVAIPLQR